MTLNQKLCRYAMREARSFYAAFRRYGLFRLHGLLHGTVTMKTKQGRLTASTKDTAISAQLFSKRQYEYDSSLRAIRFLKTAGFLPHQNLCMLDVGANIGIISIGLLLANEIDNAVTIEPEPKNFALLVKNVEQNGLSQTVRCLQMAVGDRPTTLMMELSSTNHGDHRIRSTPTAEANERDNESSRLTVQVKSLPLREIIELPEIRNAGTFTPSFLWIDVQGFEGYVFAGGKAFLSLGIPTVSEIWPYAIRRAGMSLEDFASIVKAIWSDYWIERRNKFTSYPISVFDRYLAELGTEEYFENVIFTKGNLNL
jgi:FkbM family methyltransferase